MKSPDAWQRLAAAARRAPDERDVSAPPGFAARVAARARSTESARPAFSDYFSLQASLRALGVAGLLAVAAAGASYPTLARLFSDQALPAAALSIDDSAGGSPAASPAPANPPAANAFTPDDPVAELMDVVS